MPNSSYLMQFFLDAPGSPSIDGDLLGATTVVTNGSGTVSFSFGLVANISPGQGIRATATDPANNTSEFSTEVVPGYADIQFSMANYVVDTAAGVAVITVDSVGGGGLATVSYTAGGGTAVPGVDYTPVSGTLTFGLGVTVQSFTVPIIDDVSLQLDKTVNLVLASPTGWGEAGYA